MSHISTGTSPRDVVGVVVLRLDGGGTFEAAVGDENELARKGGVEIRMHDRPHPHRFDLLSNVAPGADGQIARLGLEAVLVLDATFGPPGDEVLTELKLPVHQVNVIESEPVEQHDERCIKLTLGEALNVAGDGVGEHHVLPAF